jgi:hypothetical protein
MNDQDLHAHCLRWRNWALTRRFFIVPGAKNILARMQPSRVSEPPDAEMCADMPFFHMALHACADMDELGAKCFNEYYCYQTKNVKVIAAKLSISRDTFYERKKKFAQRALSMAGSLKEIALMTMPLTREPESVD